MAPLALDSSARPRRRLLLVLWMVALAAAAAAGQWVRQELMARSQRDGESAISRAVQQARDARAADSAGDLDAAVGGSREALELLRTTQGAQVGASYAATLVDLASRIVRQDPEDGVAAAVSLLEEAWGLPGLSPAMRGRIAGDRGALELLRGEPEAAQLWYERAEEAEGAPSPRLDALRESARLTESHDE